MIQSSPCNPVYIIQYIYSFQIIQSISSNHSNPIHIIPLICCLPSNVIQADLIFCIHQSLVSFHANIFPKFWLGFSNLRGQNTLNCQLCINRQYCNEWVPWIRKYQICVSVSLKSSIIGHLGLNRQNTNFLPPPPKCSDL